MAKQPHVPLLPGETPYQRTYRLQQERKAVRVRATEEARKLMRQRGPRRARSIRHREIDRNADHIDGYDRDDLGESPDY